jgi:hypothetical protein
MSMKISFIILFCFVTYLGITKKCFAQKLANREAQLHIYGKDINPFFENSHSGYYRNQFKGTLALYRALISFTVDTFGKINGLKLETSKPLPDSATNYMKELVLKTDKLWKPPVKNGIEDVSDSVFIHFTIVRKRFSGTQQYAVLQKETDELSKEYREYLSGTHPNPALFDRISIGSEQRNHFTVTIGFE